MISVSQFPCTAIYPLIDKIPNRVPSRYTKPYPLPPDAARAYQYTQGRFVPKNAIRTHTRVTAPKQRKSVSL
jgi:hypothetical protein